MFDLQPPRHISTLRISPVAAHSGDRLLSEPTAGTQPCRREPLFMPLFGRWRTAPGRSQLGGELPFAPAPRNDQERRFQTFLDAGGAPTLHRTPTFADPQVIRTVLQSAPVFCHTLGFAT